MDEFFLLRVVQSVQTVETVLNEGWKREASQPVSNATTYAIYLQRTSNFRLTRRSSFVGKKPSSGTVP